MIVYNPAAELLPAVKDHSQIVACRTQVGLDCPRVIGHMRVVLGRGGKDDFPKIREMGERFIVVGADLVFLERFRDPAALDANSLIRVAVAV